MDRNVRCIFNICSFCRLAKIIAISFYFLIYHPQSGICTESGKNKPDHLLRTFNKLENSQKPLEEGKIFLQKLISELNQHEGLSLKINDAILLVKENLHQLEIPPEAKEQISMAIELLQYDVQSAHTEKKELSITNVSNWYWRLYCPWEWNWYGFKKKIQSKAQNKYFYSPTEPELPAGIIIGAVEAFAGALLMIIPSGISQGIGLLLITDGGRRVFDQLEIIGDKNAQEQSQYSFP